MEKGLLRLTMALDLKKPVRGEDIVRAARKVIPDKTRQEQPSGGSIMLGETSGIAMVWDIAIIAAQRTGELSGYPFNATSLLEIQAFSNYRAVGLINFDWPVMKHSLGVGTPAEMLLTRMTELKKLLEDELNK